MSLVIKIIKAKIMFNARCASMCASRERERERERISVSSLYGSKAIAKNKTRYVKTFKVLARRIGKMLPGAA